MVYIYDILLNWTDTEKIYEFFEWHPNDSIEHIKKIPLMKVSSKVLSDLKHCVLEVDSTIMEQLKNKSEIFCSKKKN